MLSGQVLADELNVPHTSWQEALTGVHRKELLLLAAQGMAGMYKKAIQAKVEEVWEEQKEEKIVFWHMCNIKANQLHNIFQGWTVLSWHL